MFFIKVFVILSLFCFSTIPYGETHPSRKKASAKKIIDPRSNQTKKRASLSQEDNKPARPHNTAQTAKSKVKTAARNKSAIAKSQDTGSSQAGSQTSKPSSSVSQAGQGKQDTARPRGKTKTAARNKSAIAKNQDTGSSQAGSQASKPSSPVSQAGQGKQDIARPAKSKTAARNKSAIAKSQDTGSSQAGSQTSKPSSPASQAGQGKQDIARPPVQPQRKKASQTIQKAMFELIEILKTEPVSSKGYQQAVQFMESSFYNTVDFKSMAEILNVYKEKKDFKNQLKAALSLSLNHPKTPGSFYFLGIAYQDLYHADKEKEDGKADDWLKKAVENFNIALKMNRRHTPSYKALIKMFMIDDLETGDKKHTNESLATVMDMLRNLKKIKYYIPLCKAYYDTNFLKQSRKACAKAAQKNPQDPVSPIVLALSLEDEKQTRQKLLDTALNFKNSFFAQYRTALWFMEKEPKTAERHFNIAYRLQPEHLRLNEIMAEFFMKNKNGEKAYKHFLSACKLTQGRTVKLFKEAKIQLRRENQTQLMFQFKKGIEECLAFSAKQRKAENK